MAQFTDTPWLSSLYSVHSTRRLASLFDPLFHVFERRKRPDEPFRALKEEKAPFSPTRCTRRQVFSSSGFPRCAARASRTAFIVALLFTTKRASCGESELGRSRGRPLRASKVGVSAPCTSLGLKEFALKKLQISKYRVDHGTRNLQPPGPSK